MNDSSKRERLKSIDKRKLKKDADRITDNLLLRTRNVVRARVSFVTRRILSETTESD